jgi:LytS/YehU family sensor histidine kinase
LGTVIARVMNAFPVFWGISERFTAEAPTMLVVTTLVYLLAVAVHYLFIALQQARDAEVRGVQARVLAREAELRALRAQIDPHFLFNSLNSISALTAEDPDAARRMCLLLSGFLRKSLALGARERITLGEELSLVADYLAIEKVRFGARLSVEQDIEAGCADLVVPPLLMQPLVENAVRHGVAHLLEGGTIRIAARRRDGRIDLVIENPRDADRPTSRGEGLGLANVRDRLRSLFGGTAQMEVKSEASRFRVSLTMAQQRDTQPQGGAAHARA